MLADLAKRIGARLGLQPLPSWEQELAYKLRTLGIERATSIDELIARIDVDPALFREVSAALTVNETYFLREIRHFEAAVAHIVPRAQRDVVRVWSAGCSSGEEPYSLAILLGRHASHLQAQVHIEASDISRTCLDKARLGIYGPWSFRSAPPWLRQGYFHPAEGSTWQLDATIRRRISWHQETIQMGLARMPSASLDIIFFRNVSIYIEPAALATICAGFHRVLKPDGWLIQSVSDVVPPSKLFEPVPSHVLGIHAPRRHQEMALERRRPSVEEPPEERLLAPLRKRHHVAVQITDAPEKPSTAPNHTDVLNRAREHADAGTFERAFECLDQILTKVPEHIPARFLRGQILLSSGSTDAAVHELRKVIFLSPAHRLGRYWLAMALLRVDMPHKAALELAELSRRLSNLDPSDLLEDGTTRTDELRTAVDAQQRTLQ